MSTEIKLNGEKKRVKEGKTVEDMTRSLSLDPQRVMVMLNSELLPRTNTAPIIIASWQTTEALKILVGDDNLNPI